jgi:hypothetical protein
MIKRNLGYVVFCGWLMAAGGTLLAHHSLAGVYDMHTDKELSGTVTTVKFTNPHGSMAVMVKNADGTSTEWVMTLGSVNALAQKQVGKIGPNALHTGDNVKIKFLPAKDGSPLGFLKSITYPDGHVINISAGNAND